MSKISLVIIGLAAAGITYHLIGHFWLQFEADVHAWIRSESGGDPEEVVEMAVDGRFDEAPGWPVAFSILSFPIVRISIASNGGEFTELARLFQSMFWGFGVWACLESFFARRRA